ncbi:hypothetical protein AAY55_10005 [Vibrio metoecus]|uniref:Uncharacterized protein n=1 Tax=Vibrio metoecus TaxID=1481663 RepID=A0A0N8UHQ0_VIBMT|nr:hypothetical protein AAY55_10005 [Vibrio metoecus]
MASLLQNFDAFSLWTFLALSDHEFHFLTFSQSAETVTLDCAEVSKNVRTVFLLDETKTFSFVEPISRYQ